MRMLKIAFWTLGGIILVVMIAALLLVLFFDPNKYKSNMEQLVQQRTGRHFEMQGRLKLSLFPWLAVETDAAELGNAAGFPKQPMLSVAHARLGIRLWPLLHHHVEIGMVELDSPQIRLIKNRQGIGNWSDLTSSSSAAPGDTSSSGSDTLNVSVASIRIRDALLSYDDEQANSHIRIHDLSFTTGALASGVPFNIDSSFVYEDGADLSAKVKLAMRVTADMQVQRYTLDGPAVEVSLNNKGSTWPLTLHAQSITADVNSQNATVNGMTLEVAGAKLNADINVQKMLDAPRVSGSIAMAPVSLRSVAKKLDVTLPVTSDAHALERIAFTTGFAATGSSLQLKSLQLQLDDSTLRGSAGIDDFNSKAITFDLGVDRIDADRYLPPPTNESKNSSNKETPVPIPAEWVRGLNMRGELRVAGATFNHMQISKIRVGVNARNNTARINPLQLSLYGGSYSGDMTLDATHALPQLSLEQHLNGVNMMPLFKALYQTERISGRGSVNMKLTGSGRDSDALKKTLSGTVDFNVQDGAVEGMDLWYEIRRARAVLRQQAIPARSGAEHTAFTRLRGSGIVNNGVLTNKDLDVAMQYLKVTGAGTVNLVNNTLDYRLSTTVLKIPPEDQANGGSEDWLGQSIPVTITGSLSDPKIRPDIEGMVKEKAKQRIDEEKQKLQDKLKDKLKDKLHDLLGAIMIVPRSAFHNV
ncbi:MAG: AsmA family protein [Steroidobacter sp.]